MQLKTFLSLCLLAAGVILSAQSLPPEIRKTTDKPFDAKGRPVASVWENADILTGFNAYITNQRAIYQTRARLLFDAEYLYCNIQSRFEPAFEFVPKQKVDPFSRTGIELFFQPDRNSPDYYQIAVAPGTHPYTAEGNTQVSMKGLEVKIYKKNKMTRVFDLKIPLKCIGLAGAAAGKEIGFNICCNNYDVVKGTPKQSSSFAVLSNVGFRNPATWNTITFSDRAEPGRVIVSASKNGRLNLIPNPGFKYALPDSKGVPGWDVVDYGKNVFRQEVLAMSNEWYLSAVKNSYNVLRCGFNGLDTGKEYTMKIRARSVNGNNQLGIKQFRRIDKKYTKLDEKRISLTPEFRVYTVPFKPKHAQVDVIFTRYGARGETNHSSMDIASVELYEGKDSDLEIQKNEPVGLKASVPGTDQPLHVNISGERAVPLKVLAFARSSNNYSSVREIREVFAGTGAECDILCGTERVCDIYTTKDDPDRIRERLTKGQYDLYLVSNNMDRWAPILPNIGEKTAERIWKNVKNGAVAIFFFPKKYYAFEKWLKGCRFTDLPANHPFWDSCPGDFPQFHRGPAWVMKSAAIGKGKVFILDYPQRGNILLPKCTADELINPDFPFEDFAKAWLTRIAWLATDKVSHPITGLEYSEGKVKVTLGKTAGKVSLAWDITSASGEQTGSGKEAIRSGAGNFNIPADRISGGWNLLSVRTLDAAGKVLDYRTLGFRQPGPEISISDPEPYHAGKTEAEFRIGLSEVPADSQIEWELADFAGRVLESGSCKVAKEQTVKVPLKSVFTTYNTLNVKLKQSNRILSRQTLVVMVQDRDVNRMLNDGFTQRLWATHGGSTDASYRTMMKQMRSIGVRMVVPAVVGLEPLREGIICGMKYLSSGDIFVIKPQKTHVRGVQFNTAESREKIRKQAEKNAVFSRNYGFSYNSVCDEPNLAKMETSDELDSHPENIAEFRRRMEKKYGTITEFNRRMRSNWKSFDEIQPILMVEARKTGRYGEFIEWRNFNVDRWCEIIKLIGDAGKKVSPHARFALTNSFGQGIFSGNDYAKLYRKAGLDFATEYSSCIYLGKNPIYNFDEFMRSFAPEMRSPGSVGYLNSNAAMISYSPWWFAAHRYGGMGWYAMLGTNHHLLDGPTLALTKDAVLLGKSIRHSKLQQGIGKLFLDYRWKKRDIAIYYSQTSMQTAFLLGKETRNGIIDATGPLHNYFYSRQGAFYALEYLLHQYDFVAYDQVEDGILKDYKVLIMPCIISMTDKEVAAIKKFIANGGKVIADFAPGVYDELGFKRAEAPLKDVTLTGKIFDEMSASCRKNLLDWLRKSGVKPLVESAGIVDIPGRETMHFTDGVNHVFPILHNASVSKDDKEQTFVFPVKGHLYDLRQGKYLGKTDRVTCRIPNADAVLFGVYPGKMEKLEIVMPSTVKAGNDLKAALSAVLAEGVPGRRIYYVQVVDPSGKTGYCMDRCLVAKDGKADFRFRMAFNDPDGVWTLKVTDVLTGVMAERKFTLKK